MLPHINSFIFATKEEQKEKGKLLAEGFPDWNRKDFRAFCSR